MLSSSGPAGTRFPQGTTPERLAAHLRRTNDRWGFVLDHDGTLTSERSDPSLALPSQRALAVLRRLRTAGHAVAIASGRPLTFVSTAYPLPELDLVGSHGAEIRTADGMTRSVAGRSAELARTMQQVRLVLQGAPTGLRFEPKPFGLAVHVRGVRPTLQRPWLERAQQALRDSLPSGFEVLEGRQVVEMRLCGTDKGNVVRVLLRAAPLWGSRPIVAIGDDPTDEELFAALRPGDVGIVVAARRRPSAAVWRLPSPTAVVRFLERMAAGK